ncbi:MAG: hypothetical protein JW896_17385 [Deltaproteobacteria bacterium]|nr:hypothetical protein [Deltaproteobacteria bacterium]
MIIEHRLSDPEGDIPIGPREAELPFKISLHKAHPYFKLGDYFKAIEHYLLKTSKPVLIDLVQSRIGLSEPFRRATRLVIRSEKHGHFSHIASAEFMFGDPSIQFAVITALNDQGKAWLRNEYDVISYLNEKTSLPYLPDLYYLDNIQWGRGKETVHLMMVLAEWLEDYHEWHLHPPDQNSGQMVRIWDSSRGHRLTSQAEAREVFRQSAKILTLYYESSDFRQIYPWHHGAGDFVVKTKEDMIHVKLTTARRYERFTLFDGNERIDPLLAITYFFLNLTVRMRLDRIDGTGDPVWARDDFVYPVIEGFFEGIEEKRRLSMYQSCESSELLSLLKSFSPEEIKRMFSPLLDLYRFDDPQEYALIQENLDDHALCLHSAIQRLPQ